MRPCGLTTSVLVVLRDLAQFDGNYKQSLPIIGTGDGDTADIGACETPVATAKLKVLKN